MNVTKVKLKVDQAFGGKCHFVGEVFYITKPYRRNTTQAYSDIFDAKGELIGILKDHWFDYGDKKVFERVGTEDV